VLLQQEVVEGFRIFDVVLAWIMVKITQVNVLQIIPVVLENLFASLSCYAVFP
jgi:hypothetical protein